MEARVIESPALAGVYVYEARSVMASDMRGFGREDIDSHEKTIVDMYVVIDASESIRASPSHCQQALEKLEGN